ncbi:DUF2690 domain-containing protein [Nocardiopsis suaedae]|uniref:DUF2690 domain-containing protein n=1 Tax=Nocardiopsis suaedae TaxID=3018444 RepID=A0ABT4TTL4_9ACTN|nr:DUF2690 domain-containing protein [Nocardiopsis suaedae]MDA2808036.1 DUF2690 domain-containing protein [Nocardiopsis suaedae]
MTSRFVRSIMSKKRFAIAAISSLTFALTLLSPTTAQAAAYDGQNPSTSGCAADAITAKGRDIKDGDVVIAGLDLRYSPSCRTAWARVRITPGSSVDGSAKVVRNSDGRSYSCSNVWYSETLGVYTCYTAMVNDAGVTSYASGSAYLDGSSGSASTGSY